MSNYSRRDLLKTGLTASAATLLPSSSLASPQSEPTDDGYDRQTVATVGPGPSGWKSGQDSPVHDSDRVYPVSGDPLILENGSMRLAFDRHTGALTEYSCGKTGWKLGNRPELGESFEMFVPIPGRAYSPVLGARNTLASFEQSKDGTTLHLVWSNLQSEYAGKLDIALRGTVRLETDTVAFDMEVINHSPYTVASVSWPIIGQIGPPDSESRLRGQTIHYGTMHETDLHPDFSNDHGYFGTNYPIQMSGGGLTSGGRFVLIAAEKQGLYIGAHETSEKEIVRYFFELKPGYSNSYNGKIPQGPAISGHPVRVAMRAVHFPFINRDETGPLSRMVFSPYQGDWHSGVDRYREWKTTWFQRPRVPAWSDKVHSWQQLQIDSSESDLRTSYRDLPRRIEEAAKNGIVAVQLVGWNKGGQDRGNPSHDTDPRLGTREDLKDAIARIQKMGVHMVLFSKFTWADVTTEWYKKELYKYMATDPYGIPYPGGGYEYQTPEQLAGIDIRRFCVGCINDAKWLAICAREFQKIIDLGASGMLFDEAGHHSSANYCFSSEHGHHSPASLWAGDLVLGAMFRKMVRDSVGEDRFVFAAEDPWDGLYKTYSVSYFRISQGHVPIERYADPFQNMMIAITGFDDREMINRALMYRYIMSYEPFNFKGNIDDFPLSIDYGKRVDALRKRYEDYLWNAEFRDTLEATVTIGGQPSPDYSVFRRQDGKRAVVVTNIKANDPITATVSFEHPRSSELICASPEKLESHSCGSTVNIPPRSVMVLMES